MWRSQTSESDQTKPWSNQETLQISKNVVQVRAAREMGLIFQGLFLGESIRFDEDGQASISDILITFDSWPVISWSFDSCHHLFYVVVKPRLVTMHGGRF